ncbi:MAG: serine/threonine protein kinase [Myxococcales bacterium]|nr:serine/threonine protein kinase [Myxococcales bacterium]
MESLAAFGPYSILRAIAAGDDAVSFAARYNGRQDSDQILALKVLRRAASEDPAFSERLRTEIGLAARLNHVNVAQVFDLGRAFDLDYIALEFVDGIALASVLSAVATGQKAVTAEVAVFICAEVCAGLAYAHGRRDERGRVLDIVHSRINPRTVLLSKAGLVKLVDFGLGRALTDLRRDRLDDADLRFMAPEVVRGEPYDVRADIFSVGALAYLLLTGRPIYEGVAGADLRARAARGYVPHIRDIDESVPEALAELVSGALIADPDQRASDPTELRSGFAAWLRRNSPGFGRHRLKNYLQRLLPEATYGLLPDQEWEALHRKHFRNYDADSLLAESIESDPQVPTAKDDLRPLLDSPVLPKLGPIDITKMTTGAHVTVREAAISAARARETGSHRRLTDAALASARSAPPVAERATEPDPPDAPTEVGDAPQAGRDDAVYASRPYADVPTEKVPRGASAPARDETSIDPRQVYDDTVDTEAIVDREVDPRGRRSLLLGLLFGAALLGAGGLGVKLFLDRQSAPTEAAATSASLFVTSRPQGARILIDGVDSGLTTPNMLRDLPAAGAQLTVELLGFETPDAQAWSTASAVRELTFALEPAAHRVRVDSDPPGAAVLYDGAVVGTTPMELGPIRVDYRQGVDLVLRLDGYLDEHVNVDWTPGAGESSVRRPLLPDPAAAQ